ncbi:hypothetical protein IL59_0214620 [Brucella suis bv. 4 str. 40]|nr:hypothetical protein IL59_0214620 [Brucella suis bv. 4 str. 40]
MAKKQRRDNSYYETRLSTDFPEIYARLRAGEYSSVMEASYAAGLKKRRTPLHELKNAWSKASEVERRQFIEWAYREKLPITATVLPEHLALPGPVASNRCLADWAIERIRIIQQRRSLSHSDLMDELGFPRKDVSIRYAMHSGYQLRPRLIAALTKWLAENSGV